MAVNRDGIRGAVLWAASAVALIWLAGPYWTWQIDDVFIVIAYAREWWTTGILRWTSGEVVEGYSNFLFLAALTPIVGLGADGGWWAKLLSMAGSLATLGLVAALVPKDRRGALLLAALVGWTPFCFWSILGLETPWFALLLGAGWAAVAAGGRWWGPGVALLALASLTRPEGAAYLALGVLARFRSPLQRTRGDAIALGALSLTIAYHAWRIDHFGHVLPTPYLAKFSAVTTKHAGIAQWAREITTTVGVLLVSLAVFRVRPAHLLWAALPLALQSVLLVRADGDWMGMARWLVPGVVTFAVTIAATGRARELSIGAAAALLALLLPLAAVEPGARLQVRKEWALYHPVRQYAQGLGTAMPDDIEWIVHNVPWDATIMSGDVGMMGNIPGVKVRDSVGLVDREMAELRASGRPFTQAEFGQLYGDQPGQIAFLRIPAGSETGPPARLDGWVAERFPYDAEPHTERYWVRWCIAVDDKPTEAQILRRWQVLADRYPSQPWLVWHRMLAEADAGAPIDTIEPRTSVRWDGDAFSGLPESLSFTRGSDTLVWVHPQGFRLRPGATLTSRPLTEADQEGAALALEGHGTVALTWSAPCDTPASTVEVRDAAEVPLPDCPGPYRLRLERLDHGEQALQARIRARE